jgi:hypothetical protein
MTTEQATEPTVKLLMMKGKTLQQSELHLCGISGSHGGEYEDGCLLFNLRLPGKLLTDNAPQMISTGLIWVVTPCSFVGLCGFRRFGGPPSSLIS